MFLFNEYKRHLTAARHGEPMRLSIKGFIILLCVPLTFVWAILQILNARASSDYAENVKLFALWITGVASVTTTSYLIYQIVRSPKPRPLPTMPRSWQEEKRCSKCGRKIPLEEEYCRFCVITTDELIETKRLKPIIDRPSNLGRFLIFIAGFISLFGGLANFLAAVAVSNFDAIYVTRDVATSLGITALMLFLMAIFGFLGYSVGWSIGLNPWKKGSRLTAVETTFLAVFGFLNVVAGVIIQGPVVWGVWMPWGVTGIGTLLIWWIGFPLILLSLPSLAFTVLD